MAAGRASSSPLSSAASSGLYASCSGKGNRRARKPVSVLSVARALTQCANRSLIDSLLQRDACAQLPLAGPTAPPSFSQSPLAASSSASWLWRLAHRAAK
jgi:hypothetical protein